MGAITPKRFARICEGVWRDRIAILGGRGMLCGEAALMRAVYWRLCKAGAAPCKDFDDYDTEHALRTYQLAVGRTLAQHAPPHFDVAPLLEELVRRYRGEAGLIS